jgi:hypothetical protein
MTIHRLVTRLERLERHAQAQADGVLHVWRLPGESVEEAFDRYEVDPNDYPVAYVHGWPGARASSRLATPPAPLWVSQTRPGIADLEHRLHEGMKHREAGQSCTA